MGTFSIGILMVDRVRPLLFIATLLLLALPTAVRSQPDWPTYRDARGRFEFTYPPGYGTIGPGTDDGFHDRVAAVRFSALQGLGGEAVVTKGRVLVDIQAAGGLYDEISLQLFPDPIRQRLEAALPPLTADNFCDIIARPDHLPSNVALDAKVVELARAVDRTRNGDPKVLQCVRSESVVTFHKQATFTAGAVSTRQHLYGAIRFLPPPYSSFQFVRGSLTPPDASALADITRMVQSLVVR
jgi:hypothetical protein